MIYLKIIGLLCRLYVSTFYFSFTGILLPLRPASLTHTNPQGRKIIYGTRPAGRKE